MSDYNFEFMFDLDNMSSLSGESSDDEYIRPQTDTNENKYEVVAFLPVAWAEKDHVKMRIKEDHGMLVPVASLSYSRSNTISPVRTPKDLKMREIDEQRMFIPLSSLSYSCSNTITNTLTPTRTPTHTHKRAYTGTISAIPDRLKERELQKKIIHRNSSCHERKQNITEARKRNLLKYHEIQKHTRIPRSFADDCEICVCVSSPCIKLSTPSIQLQNSAMFDYNSAFSYPYKYGASSKCRSDSNIELGAILKESELFDKQIIPNTNLCGFENSNEGSGSTLQYQQTSGTGTHLLTPEQSAKCLGTEASNCTIKIHNTTHQQMGIPEDESEGSFDNDEFHHFDKETFAQFLCNGVLGCMSKNVRIKIMTGTEPKLHELHSLGGCKLFHYIGYAQDGKLLLEHPTDIGSGQLFSDVRNVFEKNITQCVIVQSPTHLMTAEIFINMGIKHVIAIKQPFDIFDENVKDFVSQLYFGLVAHSHSIRRAFDTALLRIQAHQTNEIQLRFAKDILLLPKKNDTTADEKYFHELVLFPKHRMFDSLQIKGTTGAKLGLTINLHPIRPFIGRWTDVYEVVSRVIDNDLIIVAGDDGIGRRSIGTMACRYLWERGKFPGGVFHIKGRVSDTIINFHDIILNTLEEAGVEIYDEPYTIPLTSKQAVVRLQKHFLEHGPFMLFISDIDKNVFSFPQKFEFICDFLENLNITEELSNSSSKIMGNRIMLTAEPLMINMMNEFMEHRYNSPCIQRHYRRKHKKHYNNNNYGENEGKRILKHIKNRTVVYNAGKMADTDLVKLFIQMTSMNSVTPGYDERAIFQHSTLMEKFNGSPFLVSKIAEYVWYRVNEYVSEQNYESDDVSSMMKDFSIVYEETDDPSHLLNQETEEEKIASKYLYFDDADDEFFNHSTFGSEALDHLFTSNRGHHQDKSSIQFFRISNAHNAHKPQLAFQSKSQPHIKSQPRITTQRSSEIIVTTTNQRNVLPVIPWLHRKSSDRINILNISQKFIAFPPILINHRTKSLNSPRAKPRYSDPEIAALTEQNSVNYTKLKRLALTQNTSDNNSTELSPMSRLVCGRSILRNSGNASNIISPVNKPQLSMDAMVISHMDGAILVTQKDNIHNLDHHQMTYEVNHVSNGIELQKTIVRHKVSKMRSNLHVHDTNGMYAYIYSTSSHANSTSHSHSGSGSSGFPDLFELARIESGVSEIINNHNEHPSIKDAPSFKLNKSVSIHVSNALDGHQQHISRSTSPACTVISRQKTIDEEFQDVLLEAYPTLDDILMNFPGFEIPKMDNKAITEEKSLSLESHSHSESDDMRYDPQQHRIKSIVHQRTPFPSPPYIPQMQNRPRIPTYPSYPTHSDMYYNSPPPTLRQSFTKPNTPDIMHAAQDHGLFPDVTHFSREIPNIAIVDDNHRPCFSNIMVFNNTQIGSYDGQSSSIANNLQTWSYSSPELHMIHSISAVGRQQPQQQQPQQQPQHNPYIHSYRTPPPVLPSALSSPVYNGYLPTHQPLTHAQSASASNAHYGQQQQPPQQHMPYTYVQHPSIHSSMHMAYSCPHPHLQHHQYQNKHQYQSHQIQKFDPYYHQPYVNEMQRSKTAQLYNHHQPSMNVNYDRNNGYDNYVDTRHYSINNNRNKPLIDPVHAFPELLKMRNNLTLKSENTSEGVLSINGRNISSEHSFNEVNEYEHESIVRFNQHSLMNKSDIRNGKARIFWMKYAEHKSKLHLYQLCDALQLLFRSICKTRKFGFDARLLKPFLMKFNLDVNDFFPSTSFHKFWHWFNGICQIIGDDRQIWDQDPMQSHGFVSRDIAEQWIGNTKPGVFLIRFSAPAKNEVSITYHCDRNSTIFVKHCKLVRCECGKYMPLKQSRIAKNRQQHIGEYPINHWIRNTHKFQYLYCQELPKGGILPKKAYF